MPSAGHNSRIRMSGANLGVHGVPASPLIRVQHEPNFPLELRSGPPYACSRGSASSSWPTRLEFAAAI